MNFVNECPQTMSLYPAFKDEERFPKVTNDEILGLRGKLRNMAFCGSAVAAKHLSTIEACLADWCDSLAPAALGRYYTALMSAKAWIEQAGEGRHSRP
jgi:hypothetical protein